MTAERIFVGRKAELEQFKKVLEDPRGQAVLVVGHRGMGKSWLVDKMAETAESHPNLKCGCVRYEVTPTDSVGSTMALMMDNAFEAAQLEEGSFVGTKRRLEQWRSVLNVINIGDLLMSLRRDPQRNTRDQFLERLRLISDKMPETGRAVFIIDPEKYMQEKSASDWRIVVKDLPEKTKFVFAQRTEDELVKSKAFMALENVMLIPEDYLAQLAEDDVQDLVRLRARGVGLSGNVLRDAVGRYEGHPYAVQAALDIVKKTKNVGELPQDPTPEAIAETQWDEVCKVGADAMSLFEAYAILEVGVPDDVVEAVSGLKAAVRKRLQKDSYLRGLLREEGYGRRIYHTILADYILQQVAEDEAKQYHGRALDAYHAKLKEAREKQSAPDALAATRLTEHVLVAEGKHAFVQAFVNECGKVLQDLGLLDAFVDLSERALGYVERGSSWEAMVLGNLGLIHKTRGDLDKAEQMYLKSLQISEPGRTMQLTANQYGNLRLIHMDKGDMDKAEQVFLDCLSLDEKLGRLEGMANQYGNLGLIYYGRGDLDRAEQMHLKSLEIAERLGLQEVMASDYGNLGLIHKARGELAKAEQMYLKSLQISEPGGMMELTANQYGNLGLIHRKKGELDRAEEMYKKVLEVEDKLGRLESVAKTYVNLASVYGERGDVEKAREYWEKAVALYKKIGMPHMVEKVQGWIDGLDRK